MTFTKSSFHTLSRRFVGLGVFCLTSFRNATGFLVVFASVFARHCSWHRNFQFYTRFLHDILELFISSINEVNTTQCSSIIELRLFDSQLLLFFVLRRFRHIFQNFWPQSVWSGGRLLSCQCLTRPTKSIWWFLIQYREPCETCPRI